MEAGERARTAFGVRVAGGTDVYADPAQNPPADFPLSMSQDVFPKASTRSGSTGSFAPRT